MCRHSTTEYGADCIVSREVNQQSHASLAHAISLIIRSYDTVDRIDAIAIPRPTGDGYPILDTCKLASDVGCQGILEEDVGCQGILEEFVYFLA